jgi:hypothetical protein
MAQQGPAIPKADPATSANAKTIAVIRCTTQIFSFLHP